MIHPTPRRRLALAAIGLAAVCALPAGAQVVNEDFIILPKDGEAGDWFGNSIALSGETAIVGARRDDDNGERSGSAYLFDITTGQQIAKLLPEDGAAWDRFGSGVAISGTTAVIGAYRNNDNGFQSGSAYLFDITTGQQIAKLLPNDGAEGDSFGLSVAIYGSTIVVGAYGDDDNGADSGSAYLFDLSTGQQIAKLLPTDGASDDNFGWSVAINGTTAVVGAFLDDDNAFNSGSAYLFDTTTSKQLAKLLPSDGMKSSFFGAAVAIDGTTAIVGAVVDYGIDENSGSVYVFTTEPCPADLTNDGTLDSFDVSTFLTAYADNDPTADFNADGSFNFFDVSAFVEAFLNGCP